MQTVECADIDTCSELVTKMYYRWSDKYKMLYTETINKVEIQTSFLETMDEARAIVEPSNVDTTVTKINNLIFSTAELCKVTSRQTSRHVTHRKMCHRGMMENVKTNERCIIRYVINM